MGTAATFAELIANPASEKVFLAELKPAEQLRGWAKTALWENRTGTGIWHWGGSSWSQINAVNPTLAVGTSSTLYANFAGVGLFEWTVAGGWVLINESEPDSIVVSGGILYGNYPGVGVFEWIGGAWVQVTAMPSDDLPSRVSSSTPTYSYYKEYLSDTITLADGSTETIRKEVAGLEESGAAHTVQVSIAEVDAAAASYYHDTANGILYARASDDGTPDDYVMIAFFWLYFGTKGLILNGKYYEPYIADRGIPRISQSTPDIHWGISAIGSGSVVFLNGNGFFDQISRLYLWHNKTARILMGGDLLPYAEYATIFTGRIVDTAFTSQEFALSLRSNSFDLLRTLPVNDYWASTYPNLDPSAEGTPIKVYYGAYDAAQAPIATCINTAYAANTYQFKWIDTTHWPVKSITQVYIDYQDGAGWQAIAHANEDLAAGTFTITSASFVLGTSRVKVAFEGYHNAGVLIEGAPEIAEDILTKWCGYAAADLNAASFTASKAISLAALNVPIEAVTSALTILEGICRSDLAFFDEDGEGCLRYRTWEPSDTGTIPELSSLDILGEQIPQVADDSTKLFWKTKVAYGYQPSTQKYLYVEESNDESRRRYGKNEVLTHETYLRSAADAATLAGRLNWITRDPSPVITILLKAAQIDKNLGDKIKITLARSPFGTAGGYAARLFEIIGKELSCFPVQMVLIARDLADYGSNAGFIMSDTAPGWAAATEQERDESGFVCDASGYCLTADAASLNKSLIW